MPEVPPEFKRLTPASCLSGTPPRPPVFDLPAAPGPQAVSNSAAPHCGKNTPTKLRVPLSSPAPVGCRLDSAYKGPRRKDPHGNFPQHRPGPRRSTAVGSPNSRGQRPLPEGETRPGPTLPGGILNVPPDPRPERLKSGRTPFQGGDRQPVVPPPQTINDSPGPRTRNPSEQKTAPAAEAPRPWVPDQERAQAKHRRAPGPSHLFDLDLFSPTNKINNGLGQTTNGKRHKLTENTTIQTKTKTEHNTNIQTFLLNY